MTDKLKRKIFKKLYSDLKNAEVISYNDSIWFIDREKKYWYLEYCKNGGQLWWRYNFFPNFFKIFALERKEYEPIISEWVEEVLNFKTTEPMACCTSDDEVEEILNSKINKSKATEVPNTEAVEEVLSFKVNESSYLSGTVDSRVERVLNSKVSKTNFTTNGFFLDSKVDEILLNCKVNSHRRVPLSRLIEVENALECQITTNHPSSSDNNHLISVVLDFKINTHNPIEFDGIKKEQKVSIHKVDGGELLDEEYIVDSVLNLISNNI